MKFVRERRGGERRRTIVTKEEEGNLFSVKGGIKHDHNTYMEKLLIIYKNSVQSAYKFLQESKGAWCREANTDFWKRLWSLKIPPKISNFLRRAASGVLPTCFQLQKHYVTVNADCPLCNSSTETIQHALVECSVAKAGWHRSIVDVGAGTATFNSWLLGIFTRRHEVEMEEASMVSWAIWRARNDIVWQKKS
ncbi:uncharacterized protein LOC133036118 [Cannabis sativa]|uniref:uncharacterized protein LOC133036118 n=1 Tax=Cannabis sativa TaxID=3483 RepID=UPI0029CA3308|nr:uncharacterized protein LOC133036118 [Cannabis sativa]